MRRGNNEVAKARAVRQRHHRQRRRGTDGPERRLGYAPGATYYVALGDSLSQGFMPLTGSSNEGYVDQIYAQLHQSQPQLQLVKLGCSGGRRQPCARAASAAIPALGRS